MPSIFHVGGIGQVALRYTEPGSTHGSQLFVNGVNRASDAQHSPPQEPLIHPKGGKAEGERT